MSSIKPWLLVTLIVTTFAIVTFTFIVSGPSANEAMMAIRVAQRETFKVRWAYWKPTPRAVNHAKEKLEIALTALDNKRYAEAILLAHKSNEVIRKLGGQNWL